MWIGAAGVVLLLAAAAVLTAVRWDEIGQTAKLAGLVGITLGLLAGGKRLQSLIPLTGRAMFHLGALLIPFDMAAASILAGQTWQQSLLLASLTSVGAWYVINQAAPSSVLKWCARAAVPFAAAGLAAVSPLSMPLVLAAIAVVAVLIGKDTPAVIWAGAAAVLPIAALFEWPSRIAIASTDLGFESSDRWQMLIAGGLATMAAAVATALRPALERAWLTMAIPAVTALVVMSTFDADFIVYLTLGVCFVLFEAAAMAARRNDIWHSVVNSTAVVVETVAAAATLALAVDSWLLNDQDWDRSAANIAIAGVLFAIGWLTADRRRVIEPNDWMISAIFGSDWAPTTVMFPMAAIGAVLAYTLAPVVVGAALLTLALYTLLTGRTGGHWIALVLASATAAIGATDGVVNDATFTAIALSVGAAVVMSAAASLQSRAADHLGALVSAVAAQVLLLISAPALNHQIDQVDLGFTTFAVLCAGALGLAWLTEALIGERGAGDADVPPESIGRGVAVALAVTAIFAESPATGLLAAAVVLGAVAFDWWRTRSPLLAVVGIALAPLLAVPAGQLAGLTIAETGAAMTVLGLVLVGISVAVPDQADRVLGLAATVTTAVGLALASALPDTLSIALVMAGSTTLLVGAARRELTVAGIGFLVLNAGVWSQLSLRNVEWLEAYLALPAVAALVVGWFAHRNGTSSWVAFAPTVAVLGGVALADRFTGGSAWHAVIAGGVGVLAVIGGGAWRLVGPLLTGTGLLALVVGFESLGPAALMPTWGWLAIGGTVLLAAAVVLERRETSPLETGQHVLRILDTRFS